MTIKYEQVRLNAHCFATTLTVACNECA